MTSTEGFDGWPVDALDFFDDLSENNSSAWFKSQRPRFDASVAEPTRALALALTAEFGEPKIFRPYRDVRFSADKRPIKEQASFVVGSAGGVGAFYLQLAADGLSIAGGMYQPSTDQLERWRQAVDDDVAMASFSPVLAASVADGFELSTDNSLKTAPRGWSRDHPRIELLRLRSVTVARRYEPASPWLHTAECLSVVRRGWASIGAVNSWLDERIGPPE